MRSGEVTESTDVGRQCSMMHVSDVRVTAGATPDPRMTAVPRLTARRAAPLPPRPSHGQDRPSVRAASPHLAVELAGPSVDRRRTVDRASVRVASRRLA